MSEEKEVKDRLITVRVSKQEYGKLEYKMSLTQCQSMSEYLRLSGLKRKIKLAPPYVDEQTFHTLYNLYLDFVKYQAVIEAGYADPAPVGLLQEIQDTIYEVGCQLTKKLNDDRKAG